MNFFNSPKELSLLIESHAINDYHIEYFDKSIKRKIKIGKGLAWHKFPVSDLSVIFSGPSDKVKILGIKVNESQTSFWPWGENITLRYQARNSDKSHNVDFSIESLFKKNNSSFLIKYISLDNSKIDDKSGLIFIDTVFNKEIK